jgi:transposase-like protein
MSNGVQFPKTLLEATRIFADQEVAFEFAVRLRWPDGVTCPFCGGHKHSFLSTRKTWQCKSCSKQFSVKKGSIFEDSPIKLDKWLIAMWLIVNAKNGISSCELHRALGVTQKTAWFMLHRIRLAMQNGSMEKLVDDVEVDETFIGGKARNMHQDVRDRKITGTGGSGKVAVMGLLERGGEVRTQVVARTTKRTLQGIIRNNVLSGSRVHSDALLSYRGLNTEFVHGIVDHATTYVQGDVHTNGLENYWSLLKRTLSGTYISVEPFHLHRYLDEQSFRYNERKGSDADRFTLGMAGIDGKRVTYKKLTGKELAAGEIA